MGKEGENKGNRRKKEDGGRLEDLDNWMERTRKRVEGRTRRRINRQICLGGGGEDYLGGGGEDEEEREGGDEQTSVSFSFSPATRQRCLGAMYSCKVPPPSPASPASPPPPSSRFQSYLQVMESR